MAGLFGLGGIGGIGGAQPPAGLLGPYFNPADMRKQQLKQGLLAAGIGLLTGGKGSTGEVLGQGLAAGLQGANNAGINYKQDAMGYQQLDMQMQEQRRKEQERQQAEQSKRQQMTFIMDYAQKKGPEWQAWAQAYPEEAAKEVATLMNPASPEAYTLGPDQLRMQGDKVIARGLPKAPEGMEIVSDGQGGFTMRQGTGVGTTKPFTEAVSKDVGFATRAEGAEPLLAQYETALTSYGDAAANAVPHGLGQGLKSTDYQLAEQAGNEFLTAFLRKDSGATITPPEENLYGRIYLPRPGDSKELIEQKRQSRRRAIEGINAGLPAAAIAAKEVALQKSQNQVPMSTPPAPGTAPTVDDLVNRYRSK